MGCRTAAVLDRFLYPARRSAVVGYAATRGFAAAMGRTAAKRAAKVCAVTVAGICQKIYATVAAAF